MSKVTQPLEQSNPYADVIAALSKMENVGANRINPAFKARYVSLDALLDAVKPVLAAHNLALIQTLETEEGKVGVSTSLLHTSGHAFSFGRLMVKADGLTAQQIGGCLTYIRRQSIQACCGISVDLDLDGNDSALKHLPPKTQVPEGVARSVQQGCRDADFAFLGLERLDQRKVMSGEDGLHRVEQSVERDVAGLEGRVDAVGTDVLHLGEGGDDVRVRIGLLQGLGYFAHGLFVWVGVYGLGESCHLVHR